MTAPTRPATKTSTATPTATPPARATGRSKEVAAVDEVLFVGLVCVFALGIAASAGELNAYSVVLVVAGFGLVACVVLWFALRQVNRYRATDAAVRGLTSVAVWRGPVLADAAAASVGVFLELAERHRQAGGLSTLAITDATEPYVRRHAPQILTAGSADAIHALTRWRAASALEHSEASPTQLAAWEDLVFALRRDAHPQAPELSSPDLLALLAVPDLAAELEHGRTLLSQLVP